MLELDRWEKLCSRLGLSDAAGKHAELVAAYSEEHRHYHTAEHIEECLALFDDVRGSAREPDDVEFAIWLHDAVYAPRRGDNEERSAELAVAWLGEGGATAQSVARVRALVVATRHDGAPEPGDEELLVDIDLHVLGSSRERYDRYRDDVRREYRWVPGFLFRRKRAELLASFLERDRLYSTGILHDRYEVAARGNLERELAELRS